MRFNLRLVCLLLPVWLTAGGIAAAHTPVEFLEVVSGEPSIPIEHAVDLKSEFDEKKETTLLSGPHHFAYAVGCMGRPVKEIKAYLTWYKILDPKREPQRKVEVLDFARGADHTSLTIESAEYLLSPAQRITSGPPSDIPDGLDHYIAYRIIDAPSLELTVELSDSYAAAKRKLGKPLFLCVAAQEWHHDEFFEASHRRACLVVYQLNEQDQQKQFSTIDQFGLNQLRSSKSQWLCVRGSLLKKSVDAN